MSTYAVNVSNGEVTLLDSEFPTRKAAAAFVAEVAAASRLKYLRIEIGVVR